MFAIFTLFSQPRILSVHLYTVVIYLGPIHLFGEWMSVMSYLGILNLALNSFVSLMLSMVYRYFSMNANRFSVQNSVLICACGCIIPLMSYIGCSTIKTSRDFSLNEYLIGDLVDNLWQYDMVVSTNIQKQPILLAYTALVSFGLVPIYVVMFWCRHKIYIQLKATSTVQSSGTKNNVKRLVHALTLQSLVPLASVFPASIFYCLAQVGVIQPTIYSYFIVPCLLSGCIADPLITMRYVLPYRRFVLRLCRLQTSGTTISHADPSKTDHFSRSANMDKPSRHGERSRF